MTFTERVFDEKRRMIYPVVAALAANVLLFGAVVYPLSRKVRTAEASAQVAAAALNAARLDIASARATVAGKAASDAELAKFYGSILPPDQSAARRISYVVIDQLARKSHLTHERASGEAGLIRDSSLGKLTTTVALSGEYRDVRQFIYSLETAPDFLILENVAVAQGAEGTSALSVTVRIATYYQAGGNGA